MEDKKQEVKEEQAQAKQVTNNDDCGEGLSREEVIERLKHVTPEHIGKLRITVVDVDTGEEKHVREFDNVVILGSNDDEEGYSSILHGGNVEDYMMLKSTTLKVREAFPGIDFKARMRVLKGMNEEDRDKAIEKIANQIVGGLMGKSIKEEN